MAAEFVDELPDSGRSGSWDAAQRQVVVEFAAELRKQPGRWAKHPIPAPSRVAARAKASRITNGKVSALAEGFVAVARGGVTYVRYEGVQN